VYCATAQQSNSVGISVQGPTDVRATVEDLPDYYAVQSVMYGTTDVTRGTFRVSPPPASQSGVLSITLSAKPPVAGTGSRVTGSIGSIGKRLIYISGKPGVVYADGTFEFRNVPAGRRFQIFAHSTLGPELIIEDGDVELQLTSQRLLR
jgi:hypothetical protein